MKKIVFYIVLWSMPLLLSAHNANISTMTLVQAEGASWSLHLSASYDWFKYQLRETYPDRNIDTMSAMEFQQLTLEYAKEHIVILANEYEVGELRNGLIKLGHQTDLKFELSGLFKTMETFEVGLLGLDEKSKHQCVLKTVTGTNNSQNFVLNKNNQFKVIIGKDQGTYQIVSEANMGFWVAIVLVGLLAVMMTVVSTMFQPIKIKSKLED